MRNVNRQLSAAALMLAFVTSAAVLAAQRDAPETFTATATTKTAGGATATAPVIITVERTMSRQEARRLVQAFRAGGAAGLRKALDGVAPTGVVRVAAHEVAARLTIERLTDKGRLLTIVTDQPLLFLGAGLPGAKPRDGFDFAVIDLEIDAHGAGTGTLAAAARITARQDTFVVKDYADDIIRLTAVMVTR
jgi:hypothetical protein